MANYGYTHYTGNLVTPGLHEIAYVPQSIADGWQAFCSCGEWKEFVSAQGLTRDETLSVLRVMHDAHVKSSLLRGK